MTATRSSAAPSSAESRSSAASRTPRPSRAPPVPGTAAARLAGNRTERLATLMDFQEVLAAEAWKLEPPEGFSGEIHPQVASHFSLADAWKPRVVCEVGFNAGHSTASWILGGGGSVERVYLWDLLAHQYALPNLELVKQTLLEGTGATVHMTGGDSTKTVPLFEMPDGDLCDLIHVDGGHGGFDPLLDLVNFRRISRPQSIVVMDDVSCSEEWCWAPERDWQAMIRNNFVELGHCFGYGPPRGFCWGIYTGYEVPSDFISSVIAGQARRALRAEGGGESRALPVPLVTPEQQAAAALVSA